MLKAHLFGLDQGCGA